MVLRFLAEDAGKHLELILDTILAGLVHQQNILALPREIDLDHTFTFLKK